MLDSTCAPGYGAKLDIRKSSDFPRPSIVTRVDERKVAYDRQLESVKCLGRDPRERGKLFLNFHQCFQNSIERHRNKVFGLLFLSYETKVQKLSSQLNYVYS